MKVKICGLMRLMDVEAVNRAEPDYAGFIFAPSRRKLTLPEGKVLRHALRDSIKSVGVFSNQSIEFAVQVVDELGLDLIQLHGSEDQLYIDQIKALTGRPVIKAVSIDHQMDLKSSVWPDGDFILLDHGKGGTGQAFDWTLISQVECIPPFFMAGGIRLENVEHAMRYQPYAIDVSSGVETAGMKDPEKIMAMVNGVRQLSRTPK